MEEDKTTFTGKGTDQLKPGILERIRQKFRYGLVLFSIRNILGSLGLDIEPYYWVREGHKPVTPPKIKDPENTYDLRFLQPEEITVMRAISGIDVDHLKQQMHGGMECIGLLHGPTVAALMFIEYNTIQFKKRTFLLSSKEAYLSNMYTFNAYRGRNLAPYLRYRSYELLRSRGYDTFYSVTACLNESSKRFKEKLGAQHKALYFYIGFFKKAGWNFHLRDLP